jgi:Protein of unknown function (DUF1097)
MKFTKFFCIALLIGVFSGLIQVVDQLLSPYVFPVGNKGFGWIAFMSSAVYGIAGSTVKGGVKAFIAYFLGISAASLIIQGSVWFSALGFWAIPFSIAFFVVPVMYFEKIAWLDFIPGLFIAGATCFGLRTYVPGANFSNILVTEMTYATVGLVFGWIMAVLSGKIEKRFSK